jgi:hypothetical protein
MGTEIPRGGWTARRCSSPPSGALFGAVTAAVAVILACVVLLWPQSADHDPAATDDGDE